MKQVVDWIQVKIFIVKKLGILVLAGFILEIFKLLKVRERWQ